MYCLFTVSINPGFPLLQLVQVQLIGEVVEILPAETQEFISIFPPGFSLGSLRCCLPQIVLGIL